MSSLPVFKILPTTQKYDWGKLGLNSKVTQFISQPEFIDEKSPYAEVFSVVDRLNGEMILLSPVMDGHSPEIAFTCNI